MTDPLDLETLAQKARAATPGPWGAPDGLLTGPMLAILARFFDRDDEDYENAAANSAFIATFNPSTALALLDRLKALEQAQQATLLRAFEYCQGRCEEREALAKEHANAGSYRFASEYCAEAKGFAAAALFVKRELDALHTPTPPETTP